eukprot:CAMPEP_0203782796 /NCGR_PEP_ID=MMETSP0099_2-20121227/11294_1 /ASSEMBLY_ACC=CAM_ASM_000209 /TAXON_ID=96639 /ORGANISM=" , Strain NY0313808BC1" /LENGTH=163 /DNA_ID=CAMNT_0050684541 /DNA_START=67 /DNA_END=555 /DNA_ORIENTATION=-
MSEEDVCVRRVRVVDEGDDFGTPSRSADVLIYFLTDSYFVWVGPTGVAPQLSHIVSGSMNRLDKGSPLSTTVADFGQGSSVVETNAMAKRLALKLGAFVHICCTLSAGDLKLIRLCEKRVVEEVNRHTVGTVFEARIFVHFSQVWSNHIETTSVQSLAAAQFE